MAIQTLEWLAFLDAHHLPHMSAAHKRVLVLRAGGRSVVEVARLERVSVSTIRSRLATASAKIAACLPQEEGILGEMRGYWVGVHRPCCLLATVAAFTPAGAG